MCEVGDIVEFAYAGRRLSGVVLEIPNRQNALILYFRDKGSERPYLEYFYQGLVRVEVKQKSPFNVNSILRNLCDGSLQDKVFQQCLS